MLPFACLLCPLFCRHCFPQRLQDSSDFSETPISAVEHFPTRCAMPVSHGHTISEHRPQMPLSYGSRCLLATDPKTIAALLWSQEKRWQHNGLAHCCVLSFGISDQQSVHNSYSKIKKWTCSDYVNEHVGLLTPVTSRLPMRKLVSF